jgi:hypothetical protein
MSRPGKQNPRASGKATGAKIAGDNLHKKPNTADSAGKAPSRQKAWREANPARYLAHLYIQHAKRLGVIRPQPCAICGATRVDAHHDDYAKPGEVVWLCRRHHTQLHARRR